MTTFTDQFQRHHPLTFDTGDHYRGRLSAAVSVARAVLWQCSADEISSIALEVEAIVQARAKHLGCEVAPSAAAHADANAQRRDLGELALFVFGDDTAENLATSEPAVEAAQPGLTPARSREEALAVLAIWMAVDAIDLLEAPQDAGAADRFARASEFALDAVRAAEMAMSAFQGRMASEDAQGGATWAAAMQRAQTEFAQQLVKSQKGQQLADLRWATLRRDRQTALKLAVSKPFKYRTIAARHAIQELRNTEGSIYEEPQVIEWLKAEGWQKNPPGLPIYTAPAREDGPASVAAPPSSD